MATQSHPSGGGRKFWKENKFIDFVDGVQPDDGHIEVITDPDEPGTSKILIKQAEIADAGSYLCVGENEGGKTQGNATLTVEFAPIFNYTEVPFNYSWINHADPGFVGNGSTCRPNLSLPLQFLVPPSLILYLCKLCQ
jgi:hypothetical protein